MRQAISEKKSYYILKFENCFTVIVIIMIMQVSINVLILPLNKLRPRGYLVQVSAANW